MYSFEGRENFSGYGVPNPGNKKGVEAEIVVQAGSHGILRRECYYSHRRLCFDSSSSILSRLLRCSAVRPTLLLSCGSSLLRIRVVLASLIALEIGSILLVVLTSAITLGAVLVRVPTIGLTTAAALCVAAPLAVNPGSMALASWV